MLSTRYLFLFLLAYLSPSYILAQSTSVEPMASKYEILQSHSFDKNVKVKFSAQGFLTYKEFQSFESLTSTQPIWFEKIDIGKLEWLTSVEWNKKNEVEFEIEIEHGGAGVSMEYDPFEEFGEFESEVEKGGEILLSEIYYKRKFNDSFTLRVGKIPVRISMSNWQDNYSQYPTIESSSAEASMIPQDWREVGLEAHLKLLTEFNFRLGVTSGLNSEFFRKYNWIGNGVQKKFETINASDLAINASLHYGDITKGNAIGVSTYYGSTSDNRNKTKKVSAEGSVFLLSLLGQWKVNQWRLRGQIISGTLNDSEQISLANANLGTLLNPGAFSALGYKAQLEMLEISYQWIFSERQSLTPFFSYQHVDTMSEVEGSILKDERYNREMLSLGFMWIFETYMFSKIEASQIVTALATIPNLYEYKWAFGFDFN